MSGADAADRLLDAAISLGVGRGVGAMSLQAIATSAGTSKALLLYHFTDKARVLRLVRERLTAHAAGRLRVAATASDGMAAWRALVHDEVARGALALLAALALEREVDPDAARPPVRGRDPRDPRDEPAALLAAAILRSVGLEPRVPPRFIARVLLRHLDGLAVAAVQQPFGAAELEAELDAFAVALLGLGR